MTEVKDIKEIKKEKDETKIKVLVVDDSEYYRKNIIQMLEESKIQVVGEAQTPVQAKELLVSTGANVVIIDLVMPEMSGLDLCKHFKDNFRDVYIIIVSSLNKNQVVLESITLGASDYLFKPFPSHMLVNAIEKISTYFKDEKI